MTTNLRPTPPSSSSPSSYSWVFDIEGISALYASYESTSLWPLVENVPEGVHIHFLRAERSLHRWADDDISRIEEAERVAGGEGAGVRMHLLENAGHWVREHTGCSYDNGFSI